MNVAALGQPRVCRVNSGNFETARKISRPGYRETANGSSPAVMPEQAVPGGLSRQGTWLIQWAGRGKNSSFDKVFIKYISYINMI
jgi:hypothetical protein